MSDRGGAGPPEPAAIARLWAGWRSPYMDTAAATNDPSEASDPPEHPQSSCVFCRILASPEPPETTYILWRGSSTFAILNLFPYTSGHLMVMPTRHVAALEDLDTDESAELWNALTKGVRALKTAYHPDGMNVGANLGRAGGAGVPGHFHVHCVPRWAGDTNFMASLAEVRVLPEALPDTFEKLRAVWPEDGMA